jgi:hypothetical protein
MIQIQSAKYFKTSYNGEAEKNVSVFVTLTSGEVWSVPLNATGNMHWEALQEWVADGNSITAAD